MVFQDYELISTKRVNNNRRGQNIFLNRLFNAGGGYSSVYFGSVFSYAYLLKTYMNVETSLSVNMANPIIARGFGKYLATAPVFLVGFCAGTFLVGDSKEFFHLLRQYPTYRKEFKMIKNELYYQ